MPRPLLFLLSLFLRASHASSPLAMNWSSQAYGPDGPWQAVDIAVGSNGQHVALYPGATGYTSTILMASLCTNTSLSATCYAAQAGVYNASESTTAFVLDVSGWETTYWAVEGGSVEGVLGDEVSVGNDQFVPNVSFTAIYQTYETYPNGKSYPVSVGNLALGAPYTSDEISSNTTLNLLASYLYSSGGESGIPSYSYGMHIGSATPSIPGSLILGGYDRSRALSPISAQSVSLASATGGELPITLKDIALGVAEGESPFPFTSKSGLFTGYSTQSVTVDPTKPYLYLPEDTCDAITSSLPVSFNSSFGLYLWDTTASDYENITTSPSYLSFTFTKDDVDNQNITIKIPFSLLTLTLEAPLVDANTTYFPCFYDDTPVLGRAFLQAAFVAVNYHDGDNTGTWFLAQAPGPGISTSTDVTAMSVSQTSLTGSNSSWEDSWASTWHVLGATTTGSSNSTTNSTTPATSKKDSGLSSGAKIGLGVGLGVGGAILIAAAVFLALLIRKRKQGILLGSRQTSPTHDRKQPFRGIVEIAGGEAATELESKTQAGYEGLGMGQGGQAGQAGQGAGVYAGNMQGGYGASVQGGDMEGQNLAAMGVTGGVMHGLHAHPNLSQSTNVGQSANANANGSASGNMHSTLNSHGNLTDPGMGVGVGMPHEMMGSEVHEPPRYELD